MTADDTSINNLAVIRMVAGREIASRIKTKSYLLITIISLLVLVGLSGAAKLASLDSDALAIGVLPSNAALDQSFQAASTETGIAFRTVVVADEAEGRRQVESGFLDTFVTGENPSLTAVVNESINDDVNLLLNIVVRQKVLRTEVALLGGDATAIRAKVNNATLDVQSLHPPQAFDKDRLSLGFIAGLLIYIALVAAGQSIAQGVVEEKTSRVVEILLSSIKPWQLMTGKILGIGAVSLLQIVILGVGGCVSAVAFGSLAVPSSAIVGAVVWLVVWFLLGFTVYAIAFAGLGALVSRQEDVGSVVTPVMALLIGGYGIGATVLPQHPDNSFVAGLSLLPMFSPMIMPIRLAIGNVPTWQIVVSIALVILVIPILTRLGSRIYKNSVVRSGARVSLRTALRG